MDADDVIAVNEIATGGLWPDIVVYLDIDPNEAHTRTRRRHNEGQQLDRLEREGLVLQLEVRHAFLDLASRNRDSWIIVDGNNPLEDVTAAVTAAVEDKLELTSVGSAR